jgi:hypothetical protein
MLFPPGARDGAPGFLFACSPVKQRGDSRLPSHEEYSTLQNVIRVARLQINDLAGVYDQKH